MPQNIFGQSNQAYGQANNAFQSINPYGGGFAAGSGMVSAAANDPSVNNSINMLGANSPNRGAARAGFSGSVGNPAVQRTMNQYLNPYQGRVIDDMLMRSRDQRNQDLNQVQAQAAQASAFGGARHGLVEAELMDRYSRNENESVGQFLNQGFMQSAGLGQQQQQIEQSAASGMLGVAGQDLQQRQAVTNAELQQRQQQFTAGQLLAALQGGADQTALSQGNAFMNSATIGQNLGMQALNAQMNAGAQVQGLNQSILDQGSGQYDQYANYPTTQLATALAGVSGNPLAGAGTTTRTSRPGLFDYLSLGTGLASAGK